jgi:hypothetical protein
MTSTKSVTPSKNAASTSMSTIVVDEIMFNVAFCGSLQGKTAHRVGEGRPFVQEEPFFAHKINL